MKKIYIDAHTHTVASGHAYSSLQEMARAAADKGIQYLGITEHGPSIEGTCPLLYFKNMFVVPREMYGVNILMGCEVNILDTFGNLDLNDEYLDRLDIGIAGIHIKCWKGGTKEENTQGVIKVIRNPKIHIISHPGDGTGACCQGVAHAFGNQQSLACPRTQKKDSMGQQPRDFTSMQAI